MLTAKNKHPSPVPCQTPQNRIRSKGQPNTTPLSAPAPAPAAVADTAEDDDEEEDQEGDESSSKVMVTSPDGTIVS